ncbi:NAD(P)-binding protein [Ruminococcaceae bacterium OttesenSCG-928-I18]|nr:NAD(P)-binding protein [Ruminococcaceae bacterium OttesenSCG-928-I18]
MGPREMRVVMRACTQEEPPECTATCPVHFNAKGMCKNLLEGHAEKPLETYQAKVLFPRLVSAFCLAPCEGRCAKQRAGQAISIRALEENMCRQAESIPSPAKPLLDLPKTAAVIGGGIKGLACAFQLYDKGFKVSLYEKEDRLGGHGWLLDAELARLDFALLDDMPWKVHLGVNLDEKSIREEIMPVYDGVLFATEAAPISGLSWDEQTNQCTSQPKLFWCKHPCPSPYSIIDAVACGRKTATSAERFLKSVSLTASRQREGSYQTTLYTDIDETVPVDRRVPYSKPWPRDAAPLPGDPAPPKGIYSAEDAGKEAARCIQCECMKCVKQCVYMQEFESYPRAIIHEMATHIDMLVGQKQSGPLINSCSVCGLCTQLCPYDIGMPQSTRGARVHLVENGDNVEATHDFPMRDLAFSNGENYWFWSHGPDQKASRYLFFPGCQLAAVLPELMLPTYQYLRQKLGEEVGIGLGCCGAPAHWAGYDEKKKDELGEILTQWREMGEPTVIAACPTCQQQLEEAEPTMNILSLWQVMAQQGLPATEKQRPRPPLAIQDACGSRHQTKVQDAVRELLAAMGCPVEELAYSRENTKCCNYGGLVAYANASLAQEALAERLSESDADYLVYCGACREQCQRGGKTTWHLLELLFGEKQPPTVDISLKRDNRIKVKQDFYQFIKKDAWTPSMEKIHLIVSEEVRKTLDKRLVLEEDIQRVIEMAERTGVRLKKADGRRFIAHSQLGIITYWVEYEPVEEGYVIHSAYSHRLQIVEDVKKPTGSKK